ncbi:MAG: DEAD/DEAH box helicase [Planctomycetes bacterium]|nr:DEAD/DEAH box helicase [Planctomycetota bacterium]
MTFDQFGLAEPILRAVRAEGYTTPTPIQIQAIPPVMAGRDLIGLAQTGTGKTAAFALPVLHALGASTPATAARPRDPRVLVLAPTRELAAQVNESFRVYGRHLHIRTTAIFGGVGFGAQLSALRAGLDVLVACPGRLLDLLGQPTGCSTWASCPTSAGWWRCAVRAARPCCSAPPCRARSGTSPRSCCATRSRWRWRRCRRRPRPSTRPSTTCSARRSSRC